MNSSSQIKLQAFLHSLTYLSFYFEILNLERFDIADVVKVRRPTPRIVASVFWYVSLGTICSVSISFL